MSKANSNLSPMRISERASTLATNCCPANVVYKMTHVLITQRLQFQLYILLLHTYPLQLIHHEYLLGEYRRLLLFHYILFLLTY